MKIAPPHSITSSAVASSEAGIREAKRLRCSHVQHELEFCRLLDRKIGRVCALQYLVHMARRPPIKLAETRAIGHETSGLHQFPEVLK